MQSQYTINGKVYRLVEEEKKPERLGGWLNGHCFIIIDETVPVDRRKNYIGEDSKRMIEIRDNETIVSRDDVIKAWENVFKNSDLVENVHLKICNELGL